jgi:hypothetical protein
MTARLVRFNLYLLLLVTAAAFGCKTSEERKQSRQASTLRVYLQTQREAGLFDGGISVYRMNPVRMTVDREPFLTEVDLEFAEVIEVPGGYAIRAQFNGHGALVLEGVTVAHKGRHMAIRSDFGETRWLAAPLVGRRITNGELVFTPDANREEAERIVRGLNNVVRKIKKRSFIG